MPRSVPKPVAFSYGAILLLLILSGWLHLMTPLITVLFSYFVLSQLTFWRSKWIAIATFLVLVAAIFWAFVFFLKEAVVALPDIVENSIPVVVRFAEKNGIELPFTDVSSLKEVAMESVRGTLGYLGNFAKIATKEFVFLVVGVVIATGIFINPAIDPHRGDATRPADLYAFYSALIAERFRSFYQSFERVMGAQILISGINTVLTATFLFGTSMRYASILVVLTFVCGLLPVVGNLISNALIVGMAFTKSPQMAGWALAFLVSIHKLEYFLNSKIVGSRIRHPMWLTLLALILGERLMGIPGLILAPVVLHYVKVEASRYAVAPDALTVSPAAPRAA
jgi:predicted PurR-regulated permease PerM